MCSWINYIMGIDSCLFQNMEVWDSRHNTDLYLVLGRLHRARPAAHLCYLGRRTRFLIRPLEVPDRLDRMLAELLRAIPRPPRRERYSQAWILPDTWSLIDTSISARQWKD